MRVYILAMEFRKFLAKRLKEVRLARGLTQDRLAQLCGLPTSAIGKYEAEVIIPSVETLKKLAETLEVTTDYFVFGQAKMEGVPKIKDPLLYERYFVLESLGDGEREAALFLLESLIARHRFKEMTAELSQGSPGHTKKAS